MTLSPASGKPVSATYADAATGTATSATDYRAITGGTLNFAAGDTEKTVTVTVNGDTTDEPHETVILRLSSPSNARLSGGSTTLDGTGTITDDDDAPTVSVADATAVNEGHDPDTTVDMSFTVTLSEASSLAVTVPYTLTGTATGGSDYETPASTSLAIPAGDASGTIVVKVKGDALDEPNETIVVTLGAPTNATVSTVEGAGTGTGTITDDDGTPAVTLELSSASITENGGSSTVTASLSSASSQAVTLTVAAAAVSPAAAGDLTLSGTTLTIAAGATESTGTVTVTAVDNDVDAANKTVTVSATATGGNGVANPADATLTITDDDTRGVTVTGVSLTMDEADKAGTQDTREDQASYTVVLDSEPTDDVRINITAPAMVTLSPTSLTFTPSNWNQAQTVTATAVNDAIDNAGNERTGNITHAVVEGDSDYAGVAAESVAVTVNDDDGTPTLTLELDPTSIAESGDGNSTTVTATLSGASSQAVTLTVAASAVSPAAAGDFTLSGTTLTIAAGATESTGTVTVTAVDNDVDAANKTVTVSATASGGGVADPSAVTLTITDDDTRGISVAPVTLTLAEVDDPLTESATEHQKTYSIELDSQPTGTVTVNLSSGDTTIATLSDNSLEFTASDWDAQTVTVTAVADAIDNAGDERTVTITHTVSAAGTDYKDETAAAVDVTVTDDDGEPTLSIDSPSVAEGDSSTVTMTFKVTLSPASGKPVSVTYADATTGTATSATDYAAITGGTLNFAAGDTEKTVTVTVNGDTTDEPHETVILRLSSPSNARLSGGSTTLDGTGTITDDDDAPTVSVADATAVNEGHDPDTTVDMSFTVTLSEASSLAVTVPYTLTGTATGGSDYETPSSTNLSIPAGDASGTIVIKVKGDALDEPNETIIVTLGAPTNATASTVEGAGTGTGTITDDDGTPSVTLKLSPTTIAESGDDNASTVAASLSSASSQDVTLTVAALAVSPAAAGDFTLSGTTLTIAAGATESTGTVTVTAVDNDVDAADKSVTVSATASGGGVADPSAVTLTITDDDDRGISVSPVALALAEADDQSTQSISEHQKTYTVELDSQPTGTVTVNLSSGDTKIATLSDNSLEFTASDWDAQTVTVTAVADDIDNAGDARTVRITHTVSAAGTDYQDETAAAVDVTVTDDDGEPTLSIDAPSIAEGDNSTATMTFKVTLSPASGKPVSVAYADATTGTATSATDYAAITGGTLNFAAGDTEKTVTVTVNGDTTDEPHETVILRLSSPSNARLSGGETTLDGTGTITDDDDAPTVSVANATAVNEGNDPDTTVDMSFTVSLSEASSLAVTVPYTLTGTATGGSDYETPASTSLSIAAGDTSGTIIVKVKGDALDEPNETIVVTLGAPTNATVSTVEGAGTGTGTITDDDGTPAVTLELSSASIAENGGASTVTATLGGASSQAVTLTVAAAAVSPAATGDFTVSANKTLTIAAGATESTGTVTITAVDNDVDAANKTVTVSATASGGGVSAPSAATLTITDDDTRGVTVTGGPMSMAEADNAGTAATREDQAGYTVVLDSEPTDDVRIDIAAPAMATLSPTSLTFTPSNWNIAQTVTATAVDDALDNLGDTRTGNITHAVVAGDSDYASVTAESVAVTVNDDDGEPTLGIDAPSVAEGDSSTATLTFKVTLTPASGKPVSVGYADAATGTATSATDYAAISSGTLNFAAGQTEKTVDVTVNGDTAHEPNETVVLRLSSASNARLTGGAQTLDGTGTITDDDDAPTVSVADATAVNEGNDPDTTVNLSFAVTLDALSGKAVTVPYTLGGTASAGTDYTAPDPLSVVVAAGSRSASIDIPVKGDTLDEPDETVTVTLGVPTNATVSTAEGAGAASGTITDDDAAPTVSVANAAAVNEGDDPDTTVAMNFTVTLSAASAKAITVPYTLTGTATGGSDYETPSSTSLSMAAGDNSGTIVIKVKGDALDEPNETIIVTLGTPTNATVSTTAGAGTGTGTITDDDGTPAVTLELSSASITENGGASTVAATLGGASSQAVTLTVAAAAVSPAATGDFTVSANKTLTIAAGATESTGTVTITAVDNDVDAANKTVTVSATASGGGVSAPSAATLTITDDDTRGVTVTRTAP